MNTKNEKFKDLKDIAEVKELNLISDVNRHIKLGWKLLDTYKMISTGQNNSISYFMGWPKSASIADASLNKPKNADSKAAKKFIYSL